MPDLPRARPHRPRRPVPARHRRPLPDLPRRPLQRRHPGRPRRRPDHRRRAGPDRGRRAGPVRRPGPGRRGAAARQRGRPGLPAARRAHAVTIRRRVAAAADRLPAAQQPARRAVRLRRAVHRPAPARRGHAGRRVRPAARRRRHDHRHRPRPGPARRRRPPHRHGAGRRPGRRAHRRRGHARGGRARPGQRDRAVAGRASRHRARPKDRKAHSTAVSSSRPWAGCPSRTRRRHSSAGSGGRGPASWPARRAMPVSTLGSSRRSTRPSVYSTRQLPGPKVISLLGTVAGGQPQQQAAGLVKDRHRSVRLAQQRGRVPGLAVAQGPAGRVDDGHDGRGQRLADGAADELIERGEQARRAGKPGARARAALRTWPIVMAASSPCPATSPTTSISRPSASGMASYQSPPMP